MCRLQQQIGKRKLLRSEKSVAFGITHIMRIVSLTFNFKAALFKLMSVKLEILLSLIELNFDYMNKGDRSIDRSMRRTLLSDTIVWLYCSLIIIGDTYSHGLKLRILGRTIETINISVQYAKTNEKKCGISTLKSLTNRQVYG